MGVCYSVIAASRMLQMQRRRGTAAILPRRAATSQAAAPPDADSKKKRKGKWRRSAPILGEADQCGPSVGECFAKRYRLGAEVGRGEFGVTRRCEDVATGESLACKTIRRKRLRQRADAEDVRREVEILRRMSALEAGEGDSAVPVVRLREACEDPKGVHLVMELCEGGELFDRIFARSHYSERAAAKIGRTIAQVVQLFHDNGVMHRDLKPENFLFANKSEDSPLKAIDFGLSVYFKPGERFTEVVGSGIYMAPEVLMRSYGPEADVWSAGIIFYILLCGVPPFWGDTDERIAESIIRGEINFEREPWPKVSNTAKDLVKKMLDPDPSTRLTAKQVFGNAYLNLV